MDSCEQIADQLAEQGWACMENWLTDPVASALAEEARQRWEAGAFRPAAVGRGTTEQLRLAVRGDQIDWWDPTQLSPAQQQYVQRLEQLLRDLNRLLFLNLATYEAHFALYPPQTRYQRHFDRFQNAPERTISTVLYLNQDWQIAEGGQLRLHLTTGSHDLLPRWNRLVLFRSADLEHEVLPATRERLSITGWLRRRPVLPVPVIHEGHLDSASL